MTTHDHSRRDLIARELARDPHAIVNTSNDIIANDTVTRAVLRANPVIEASAIPEPASLGLMGIALAGLTAVCRREQK